MTRREAIQRTALMMGYTISASAMVGVLNGCQAERTPVWAPSFLSEEQGAAVMQIADRLLPKTETPGAIDVGVPEFIDKMLEGYYNEEEKQLFLDGLSQLDKDCMTAYKNNFADCTTEQQNEILQQLDQAAFDARQKGDRKPSFFPLLKEMTFLGYFTSEIVGTEVLNYDPIPGNYDGCIPMSEVENGRTWSL